MLPWIIGIAIAVLVWLGVLAYGSARIESGMFLKAVCSLRDKKAVLLTFDDGPHPVYTPQLLDTLKRHDIRAMFFCIGEKAAAHPEIIARILAEGHTIGNHTQHHTPKYTFYNKRKMLAEVKAAHDALAKLGIEARYFRPPLGVTNGNIAYTCKTMNYTVVGWNVRSFDTRNEPQQTIIDRIFRKMNGGDIILLHDRLEHTSEVVDQIAAEMKRRNLHFATPKEIEQNQQ